MGCDKAGLVLDGRTLLEHALDRLRAAGFAPVRAGFRAGSAGPAPLVHDGFMEIGPVAGLEAGLLSLAAGGQKHALFTPVDVPGLPPWFLRWLWERAQASGAAATVPMLGGRPQPLCAVYAVALAPLVRALLAAGERKVMQVVALAVPPPQLDLFAVESVAPLAGWSGVERWFDNLNTPQDWERMTAVRSLAAPGRI